MKSRLILYYREGCHLCEAFSDELCQFQQRYHFEYDRVDVDTSPELVKRYGLRVPVLASGDRTICEFFLDPERLLEYVR